ESVLAAMAAGASDYLRKPFDDLKVVRAKIRAALGRRAERVKNRDESRRIAKEASELLEQGKLVPDPIWEALERELALYDQANRQPGRGVVRVVGSIDLAVTLRDPSFDSELAFPDEAGLEKADVVVLSMDEPGWRAVAERLAPSPAD